MRTLLYGVVISAACFLPLPAISAPPAPPAPAANDSALPADASVDAVLDALDQRGKTLKDFTANVRLAESNPALGITDKVRTGRVLFQRKAGGDARMRIVFEKRINGTVAVEDKKEYLLDDGWLTDRDYQKKIWVRRRVVREGQKIDLLKLGEGPFPLPIGQSKEDVHRHCDVTKAQQNDVPNTIHLTLTPTPGTPMARKLTTMDIWVDRQTHMPVRIDTTEAGSGEERRTHLKEVTLNPPGGLKDSDFTLPEIKAADWSGRTEEFKD